jgi:DNA polymerase-3 subunit delta'
LSQRKHNRAAYLTLAAYLRGGRLPHAILAEGPNNPEKDAFVSAVAMSALCEADAASRPCGECRHCVKAAKGIHPDILSYGGEGGARSFHIDTVRELRKEAYVRPNEADGKVLILREVQNMSVQAQNALLKVIEEPPRNVTFLLTCENKAVLLETIRSRVAVIALGDAAVSQEESEDDGLDVAGLVYDACIGDELAAMGALAAYERNRPGLHALLERMHAALGEAMLRDSGDERLQRLISRYGHLRLFQILAIIDETREAVDRNAGGLLLVTSFTARIRAALV